MTNTKNIYKNIFLIFVIFNAGPVPVREKQHFGLVGNGRYWKMIMFRIYQEKVTGTGRGEITGTGRVSRQNSMPRYT